MDLFPTKKNNARRAPNPFEQKAPLNPKYTFQRFITGPANSYAEHACYNLVEDFFVNGKQSNLYIHGDVGIGKTHLMQAIGNKMLTQNPQLKITYSCVEHFMNEFVYCSRFDLLSYFRKKYRDCDILLLDNMQFAAGREDIQKELFDTMQALTRHGKQIVMAGDMKPQEIIGLTDDIVCVMHESVVAQMRVPEFDCRLKIVQALMKELNINLDNDSGSSLLISD